MKNFRFVNVLDTEATCYEDGIFPEPEMQEVIEFGITTIDLDSRSIVRTISIPVKPGMSSVSEFCTKLTGWTQAKLERQGVSFAAALQRLSEKHGALNRLLVTDSNGDMELIETECRRLGLESPFGQERQNVATLFALLTRQKRNLSLKEMLAHFGLDFIGTPHRAGDDSYNIARLFLRLLEAADLTPGE